MVGSGLAGGIVGKILRSTKCEQLNSGCLNFEGMAGLFFWEGRRDLSIGTIQTWAGPLMLNLLVFLMPLRQVWPGVAGSEPKFQPGPVSLNHSKSRPAMNFI